MNKFKKISPGRLIASGFAAIILVGAALLLLPFTHNEGISVSPIDALFTAASAVCVTGLVVVDTADTFNAAGQTIIAILIQIGGLGVASVGVSFIILARRKVDFKERILVKEALGLNSMKGIVKLVKSILLITLLFEGIGTILSYIVFSKDHTPLKALGISLFHSIATFNNSGFDNLGGFRSLTQYSSNVLLNLTTCILIIFGGLGFIVIQEIIQKRSIRKSSLHTKIVIVVTLFLIIVGTLLIKATEDISWLGALFFSVSARTAGFATYQVGNFANATLITLMVLMFIGASPGSTGGGIKTTTAFTIFKGAYSLSTNRHCNAFKRRISNEVIYKAFVLTFLAAAVVMLNTFFISIIEHKFSITQILFEVVSAFGTVGLSTGITPDLSSLSKLFITITMYIGRIGPLALASIWSFKEKPSAMYSEEKITIG